MGRGKVGDVVFSRVGGQQVARARNRAPKNPQTNLQILQRVMFATIGKAYSLVADIADHSFEGLQVGTPNQSRFISQNVAKLRSKLAAVLALPTDEVISASNIANFNQSGDPYAVLNDYIISSGSLPPIAVQGVEASGAVAAQLGGTIAAATPAAPTYAEVAAALGMQLGDQLTICGLVHNYRDFAFANRAFAPQFVYARIILAPSNDDANTAFLDGAAVANPNERNLGSVSFSVVDGTLRVTAVNGVPITSYTGATSLGSVVSLAAIASRQSQSGWLRSSQSFVTLIEGDSDLEADTIADAYQSYLTAQQSGLYLNQASRGVGARGQIIPRDGYLDFYVDEEGTQRPVQGQSYSRLYAAVPSDYDNATLEWAGTASNSVTLSTARIQLINAGSQMGAGGNISPGGIYELNMQVGASISWIWESPYLALSDADDQSSVVRP